jgi:cation transport protein ChaC
MFGLSPIVDWCLENLNERAITDDNVVFGYGSLLWNPGFEPAETVTATLSGYHRNFACCRSIIAGPSNNRAWFNWALATRFAPALRFRVAVATGRVLVAKLRERELISSAYEEGTCHGP